MRKLYYISKKDQKLKQFDYLCPKSILIYLVIAFSLLGFSWGMFSLIEHFTNSSKSIASLEEENQILKKNLKELTNKYEEFGDHLNDLRTQDNYLRLAANLPRLSEEEIALGTGGSEFDREVVSDIESLNDLNELSKYLDNLNLKLKFQKSELQTISHKLKENKVFYASLPAIKPCMGTIGLNGFGMREHPILGVERMHEGIDIITNVGTEVNAAGNGVVSFVGRRGGYGLAVEIQHSGGYTTVYAHLSGTLVKEGQKVNRGKVIALTGNSGLSTGPHLHYEVHHEGVKLDPAQFFFDDLVLFEKESKKKI